MEYELKIDGAPMRIFRIEKCPGFPDDMRLFVGPEGSERPHSQHDIPRAPGRFRTNGHHYELIDRTPRCDSCGQVLLGG